MMWRICDIMIYKLIRIIDRRKCIGYGIPYSAQYSNPEKEVYEGGYDSGFGSLPQPEPNGLFMPESSSATWLIMLDKEGNPRPVYVEPLIIVSPFPLK